MRLSVKRRAPSLTLENLLSCISNPRLKCQSMMTAKMFFMVSVLNESMEMMLKCLRNLGVISFRPPPGGPMAATINWSTSVSVVVSFLKQIHKQSIEFNFSVVCLLIDNRWRRKMFKTASGTKSVASIESFHCTALNILWLLSIRVSLLYSGKLCAICLTYIAKQADRVSEYLYGVTDHVSFVRL